MHAFDIINALVESIQSKHRIYTNGDEYTWICISSPFSKTCNGNMYNIYSSNF